MHRPAVGEDDGGGVVRVVESGEQADVLDEGHVPLVPHRSHAQRRRRRAAYATGGDEDAGPPAVGGACEVEPEGEDGDPDDPLTTGSIT
ncbi:hypothetical protein ACF1DV_32355 [Streptomyces achromogenes]|uniref:hypothetical protein n=1 Tax=Streptomyces achromogenes TaxID=67255 RepID=UPI0036F554CB